MRLRHRLAALESAKGAKFQIIEIENGLADDGDENHASSGELAWVRHEGESIEAFRARAEAEARVAGRNFIITGASTNE